MKSQGPLVDYELHSLGWKAFQDLCASILSQVLGESVQTFNPTRDGGRDGAFQGKWRDSNGGSSGTLTVQCKFTARADALLRRSDLEEEVSKLQTLALQGLADSYLVLTNFSVTGEAEASIRAELLRISGVKRALLFGREWITQKIRDSARLRMLVPRVYGLGDLSQILDQRAYDQAREILSSVGDDLRKFVVTQPYATSAKALIEHGFVLLLGEPASGKSTISSTLAMAALDIWGCSTIRIRNPEEIVQHWNPYEPRQFFWCDDAFGATQYQKPLADEWNRVFPHMRAAIKKGARFLLTSRDYVYRAARFDLKAGALPELESQVIIDVEALSQSEKQQILYNHVKLGGQPKEFRRSIKPYLRDIASNPHFVPEIARRLGTPAFTRNLDISRESIIRFVENPVEFLREVISNLDSSSLAALALVFMRNGVLESPIAIDSRERKGIELLGANLASARQGLSNLRGSLLSLARSSGKTFWSFRHPTIADALASSVSEDPELLDIFLTWTKAERLLTEVTCGDLGIEGVKVVVPSTRYAEFARRLNEIRMGRDLFNFLSTRCTRDFLQLYMAQVQGLGEALTSPGSYLSASAEVRLLAKLEEFRLLPDDWRLRFVKTVGDLAVETPDTDFLHDPYIRSLVREKECEMLLKRIRDELIPILDDVVSDWRSNCPSDEEPSGWFEPLQESVSVLQEEFRGDDWAEDLLANAQSEIEEAIESLSDEYHGYDEDSYRFEPSYRAADTSVDRSVFDDVDED